jgi:hypothetical protein
MFLLADERTWVKIYENKFQAGIFGKRTKKGNI